MEVKLQNGLLLDCVITSVAPSKAKILKGNGTSMSSSHLTIYPLFSIPGHNWSQITEAEVFNFIYPDRGAGVERLLFITWIPSQRHQQQPNSCMIQH